MGSCIEGQVAGVIVGAFSDALRSNAEDHWVYLKRPDTIHECETQARVMSSELLNPVWMSLCRGGW